LVGRGRRLGAGVEAGQLGLEGGGALQAADNAGKDLAEVVAAEGAGDVVEVSGGRGVLE
jgi:hypothetical protein